VVLPVGVYVVKGDQVRWVPAFDTTLIVLAVSPSCERLSACGRTADDATAPDSELWTRAREIALKPVTKSGDLAGAV
jgi:hypothetical protein